ncbi:MAG TPA: ThuA domain-containing protein [Pilimelia sp.]|nr:ThuA domain-containing protein [Pilimelia sp.]
MTATRTALVVRGGWDGHVPVAATDEFVPFLRAQGFRVEIHDDLQVYADAAALAAADLVVQCWSIGRLTAEQLAGLTAAVRAGTGLAGWHGGIVGAFLGSEAYHHLTGGVFVHHPAGFVDHELTVVPARADHEIVTGIGTVALHTEKYWVLTDPYVDVLATVTFTPDEPGPDGGPAPWHAPVTLPAVWTRRWGAGRVFVSTVGHKLGDLRVPAIRTLTERGLVWAARRR